MRRGRDFSRTTGGESCDHGAGASVVWSPSTDVTADSLEPISGVHTTSDLPGILIDGTGEETGCNDPVPSRPVRVCVTN